MDKPEPVVTRSHGHTQVWMSEEVREHWVEMAEELHRWLHEAFATPVEGAAFVRFFMEWLEDEYDCHFEYHGAVEEKEA